MPSQVRNRHSIGASLPPAAFRTGLFVLALVAWLFPAVVGAQTDSSASRSRASSLPSSQERPKETVENLTPPVLRPPAGPLTGPPMQPPQDDARATRPENRAANESHTPIPLSGPGRSDRGKEAGKTAGKEKEGAKPLQPVGMSSVVTIVASLAIVLGLFFLVAWFLRRTTPGQSPLLPTEAFEVLGRAPLVHRQHVTLIRLGAKLVLICITPHGAETLAEVTDPMEVDRLAGICHEAHPQSSSNMFRQMLQQFTSQHEAANWEDSKAGPDRRGRTREDGDV